MRSDCVFMPHLYDNRFPNVDAVKKEVTALVSVRPGPVSDVVEALRFVLTEQNIKGEAPAVSICFNCHVSVVAVFDV